MNICYKFSMPLPLPWQQRFLFDMSKELHRTVKLQATSEDMSMKQWITIAIHEKLDRSDTTRRDVNSLHGLRDTQ
jgi:predicted HicB family RNase H-like nuclease